MQKFPPAVGQPVVPAPVLLQLPGRHVRLQPVELGPHPVIRPAGVEVPLCSVVPDPDLQLGRGESAVEEAPAHPGLHRRLRPPIRMRDQPAQSDHLSQPRLGLGCGRQLLAGAVARPQSRVQGGQSVDRSGEPDDVARGPGCRRAPQPIDAHGIVTSEARGVHLDAGQPPVDQPRRSDEVQRGHVEDVETPEAGRSRVADHEVRTRRQSGSTQLERRRFRELGIEEHAAPWTPTPAPRADQLPDLPLAVGVPRLRCREAPPWAAMVRYSEKSIRAGSCRLRTGDGPSPHLWILAGPVDSRDHEVRDATRRPTQECRHRNFMIAGAGRG